MEEEERLTFEEYINNIEDTMLDSNARNSKLTFEHKYKKIPFKVTIEIEDIE